METTVKVETRVCRECGKELPITDFQETGRGGTRTHVCRKCMGAKKSAALKARAKLPYIDMSKFDDETLFAELRKRGYAGELKLSKSIAV